MKVLDILKIGAFGLTGNKMRSALTMLGVIIGVAAVIALVSIGQGATLSVTNSIQSMGSNLVIVNPVRGANLTMNDIKDLPARVDNIAAIVPDMTGMLTVKWENKNVQTTVDGTTADFPDVRDFGAEEGRFLTAADVNGRRRVAVVGQTLLDTLFDGNPAIGQTISISGQPFTVIGVMTKKGATMGRDQDDMIYVPITTLQRLRGSTRVGSLYVKVIDGSLTADTVAHI